MVIKIESNTLVLLLAVTGIAAVHAEQPFQVNPLFQDHAVLQRGKPVTVWGQGPAGDTVTVSLGSTQSIQTKINTDGHWSVALPVVESGGGPYDLTAQTSSGATQSAQ